MKKYLIVMHSANIMYGAGRSLLLWLNHSGIKYDLVIPEFPGISKEKEKLVKHLKNKPENIYTMWLPLRRCYHGKDAMSWRGCLFFAYSNFMYYLCQGRYKKKMDEYEKIYLNSLILWPVINRKNKFYIHARDIFEGSQKQFNDTVRALKLAKGVIFIDASTYQPFEKCKLDYIILNNPFDMRKVRYVNKEETLKKFGLKKNKCIYAVLGMIIGPKGIQFIIQSFLNAGIDAYLLIVGKVKGKYAHACVKQSESCPDIIFTGEIAQNWFIYAISDYIIRGEDKFCVGRTVYEGLYSGCNVIIPGSGKDIRFLDDGEKFKNQILFYEPRNTQNLCNVFRSSVRRKVSERRYDSNLDQYVVNILNYMQPELNDESRN